MSATPIATNRSATGIPTGKLAVWWLLASEIVIFGGVLVPYILFRLSHGPWEAHAANTNTVIGATNTVILLTSSFFAVTAHKHAEQGDGKGASKWLWFTILGALAFLCLKSFEWYTEITHGYTITANTFWSFYYTAAGIHAAHVIAGAILMVWVARTAARGEHLHRVENVGIYCHFVDLVWIFLFPILYLM